MVSQPIDLGSLVVGSGSIDVILFNTHIASSWGGSDEMTTISFCQAQPKPQLAGLVLFPVNPDKRQLIHR